MKIADSPSKRSRIACLTQVILELTIIFSLLVIGMQPVSIGQRQGSPRPKSDSDIYYDSGYHASVRLPDLAWRVFGQWLRKEGLVEKGRRLTRDDVNVGEADLGGQGRRDFIVVGAASWLTGADNSWQWVIAHSGKGYRVVLFAHTGYLKFRSTKSYGLRDIFSVLVIGGREYVDRYRFDGRTYRAYKCTEKDPITHRTERYPCEKRF